MAISMQQRLGAVLVLGVITAISPSYGAMRRSSHGVSAQVKRPVPRPTRVAASPRSIVAPKPAPVVEPVVEKVSLEIPDVRTQACVVKVTDALMHVDGVKNAIIDVKTRLGVVDYDPKSTSLPQFLRACADVGYPAEEYLVSKRFPKPIKLKGG